MGLATLADAGLDVPRVLLAGADFLLMEYLPPGESNPARAGEALARLHCIRQEKFGFHTDTYLATILQKNDPITDAADFYFRQRLLPVLDALGFSSGNEGQRWATFFECTRALLGSCPYASLLHGDLWSGNLYDAARGPVFIDPAVYCGDALTDIAMTRLFGGFGDRFYQAYKANTPRREGGDELIRIFQIYPLLVHARLFGGGYYRSATAVRDSFIR